MTLLEVLTLNGLPRNCPKYINVRELDAHAERTPVVVYKQDNLANDERLPDEIIKFIVDTDTIFIGSTYQARPEESLRFPSHVGANQRGGRKGWVRVRPSDGRTVVIPDYSGKQCTYCMFRASANIVSQVTVC